MINDVNDRQLLSSALQEILDIYNASLDQVPTTLSLP